MIALAAGVFWAGYTVTWWGVGALRGCKTGFAELVIPGRYTGCIGTKAASSPASATTTTASPAPARVIPDPKPGEHLAARP